MTEIPRVAGDNRPPAGSRAPRHTQILPRVIARAFLAATIGWSGAAGAGTEAPETISSRSTVMFMNAKGPDADGLRSDTYHFFAYQIAAVGILYLMPESSSGWSDEQKDEYSLSKWWDNVRDPAWDDDDFFLNYVTHPYWGAAYYVRARERAYSAKAAFWYSAFLSASYEFGAEALFEQPSVQDLLITPILGSLTGHFFMRLRHNISERSAARGYRTVGEKWLYALTDPLGTINHKVDSLLGIDVDLQLRPYVSRNRSAHVSEFGTVVRQDDRTIGLYLYMRW